MAMQTNVATTPTLNRAARRASRPVVGREYTAREAKLYELGEELGHELAGHDMAFRDALKQCRTPDERRALRAGFTTAYMQARSVNKHAADAAFDRQASRLTPHTSRKAKSNAEKAKRGRPEKTAGKATQVSDKQQASRLLNVTRFAEKLRENPIPAKVLGSGWESKDPAELYDLLATYIRDGIASSILKLTTA